LAGSNHCMLAPHNRSTRLDQGEPVLVLGAFVLARGGCLSLTSAPLSQLQCRFEPLAARK
jgi:hypothetical protein